MKVKKEVFESLRLELQEFTPQEYCANCLIFECLGNRAHGQYLTTSAQAKKYSHRIEHQNNHSIVIDTQIDGNPPTASTGGYLYSATSGNSTNVTGDGYGPVDYINYNGVWHAGSGWSDHAHS